VARIVGFFVPIWAWRYFAPVVAPLLLLGALSAARARVVGFLAILFCVAFLANAGSFAPSYKSDMQDVAAEMQIHMHPGDLVIVGQPEQTPLAYYYFDRGLKFANTMGRVKDPSYMDWVNALDRLRDANPNKVLPPILNSLKRGQQVVFIQPLTEGAHIAADRQLVPEFTAPHNYNGACCVADSAVLYKKV